MAVKLVFLGKLADLAGAPERDVAGPLDWDGLLAELGPQLAAQVQSDKVKLALDGALVSDKATLAAPDGSEIALLPPVSGG
ncbi:MoaD/ThiS family protein [Aurantiacibacter flavus]|uniref:MoaD/ThiS family protein n=1 Tax=Aurantiacibacter flavus TaxID=3145232 RepID=A0ABV0CSD0_9SPHN